MPRGEPRAGLHGTATKSTVKTRLDTASKMGFLKLKIVPAPETADDKTPHEKSPRK
jgi:hypothetical protein